MFRDAYRAKKVFVTGHTGFKGSWLSCWLVSLGAHVYGYSKGIPTNPANFIELELAERMESTFGDIRERAQLSDSMQKGSPEIIFHLAAQPLVRESYENPVETFETNILGTLNVLEAARNCPSVKSIVIITSDKCYKNNEWAWGYRETDALGGVDPYSASKACSEIVAQSYFQSFFKNGVACATVRAGNVIGGGDWAKDRIVPDCARAWAAGKSVNIRNPEATRPWQHVLEPLSGYLWLGAMLMDPSLTTRPINPYGEAYNFGPSSDIIRSVGDVVAELGNHWPDFRHIKTENACTDKKECGLLKLSCDKALYELDWKATLTFDETIQATAEWYKTYYKDKQPMWNYTLDQIDSYARKAASRGLAWAQS